MISESITYSWKEIRASRKITYDEFQLVPYDGLGHHLVKGVAASKHQWISSIISQSLGNFVDSKQLGRVKTAPYDVKFSEDSGYQNKQKRIFMKDYR